MRKTFFNFIVMTALFVTIFASCKKDKSEKPEQVGQIAVNLQADITPPATRVANDQWEANDKVGLFMKRAGQSLTATGAVYSAADNVQMSISEQGTLVSEQPIMYPSSGYVDFIAYYPYNASAFANSSISVGSAVDVLYSSNVISQAPTASPVTLNFFYVQAKLEITVTNGLNSALTEADFAAMTASIENMYRSGSLQLATGVITRSTQGGTMTLRKTGSTATSASFETLVVPHTAADGEIMFEFHVNGVTYRHVQPVNYASNNLYRLNFAIIGSVSPPESEPKATLMNAVIIPRNQYPVQNLSADRNTRRSDNYFELRFPNILRDIEVRSGAAQLGQDWTYNNFLSHTGTTFNYLAGDRDIMSYFFIDSWNDQMWNHTYNNVMAPSTQIKNAAVEDERYLFAALADLLQVVALTRLTVYHGPLIYSEYGQQKDVIYYDSEQELYNQWFAKLDEVQVVFQTALQAHLDAGNWRWELAGSDASYNGNLWNWLKFINSMRLRLAMRIVKADPTLAKLQGEKAINDPVGLILYNGDNFNTSLLGSPHPAWTMSDSWNDCRMGAAMEEVLVGYTDPRIYVFFQPVPTYYPNFYERYPSYSFPNPVFPYKGIASGTHIINKEERISYSRIGTYFSSTGAGGSFRKILTAAEINFILAEAALRGWAVPKTAGEYYEQGVRVSFEDWGASGVDAYLADNVSLPIDYRDPADARNNYDSKIKITIKWDDAASNETKLERIMTQKWIDSFQNANEMWSDHRRTGYPRLYGVVKNDSNAEWGIIPTGEFIKRLPFVEAQRRDNAAGVADATIKLGGPNLISTRLWIHPAGSNFQF